MLQTRRITTRLILSLTGGLSSDWCQSVGYQESPFVLLNGGEIWIVESALCLLKSIFFHRFCEKTVDNFKKSTSYANKIKAPSPMIKIYAKIIKPY